MKSHLIAAAAALGLTLGWSGCAGYEHVDISELGELPTATLYFSGSSLANGRYLQISGSCSDCTATSCTSAFTNQCVLLGNDGSADGGIDGRGSLASVCPGTWTFTNAEIFTNGTCSIDAPEVENGSCVITPTSPATLTVTVVGPNLVSVNCNVQSATLTFDVTID